MAFLFGDSFDFYAPGVGNLDLVNVGGWSATGGIDAVNTRFSYGKSFQINGPTFVTHPIPQSSSTVFVAFPFYPPSVLDGTTTQMQTFSFRQGASAQISITLRRDGAIEVRRGTFTGTLLATFPLGFIGTIWTHIQVRVVFHATAGSVTLRVNGDPNDTFTVTGVNTMNTANAYADGIGFNYHNQPSSLFDDLLVWDNSGPVAPNTWVGDIRAYDLVPSANTAQKDFTPSSFAGLVLYSTQLNTGARVAGTIYARRGTAPTYATRPGKFTIRVAANFTGHLKGALYLQDVNGNPGVLLGVSAEVTNPVAGDVDLSFSASGAVIPANAAYLFCLMADGAVSLIGQSSGSTTGWVAKSGFTYSSGFPSDMSESPGWAGTSAFWLSWSATAENYSAVADTTADGDTSYVAAGVVGALDLYELEDLPTTPAAIYAVQIRSSMRKSDANTRIGQVVVKSGATIDLTPAVVQSTSYTSSSKVYTTDPNTGLPWTASAINALQIGPKVAG